MVECMAEEVGGAQAEATKEKIYGLKKLIGNSVNQ